MSDPLCVCGHTSQAHIYDVGACRPGFRCRFGCEGFQPLPDGFHRHYNGYCSPDGVFFADEDGGMRSSTCPTLTVERASLRELVRLAKDGIRRELSEVVVCGCAAGKPCWMHQWLDKAASVPDQAVSDG